MTYDHSMTGLLISAALGITAALIILWSGAYVALCRALDTRTDRRARRAARTRHKSTPAADDTVTLALNDACCERWWTSCGFHHDPTCPRTSHRETR